MPLTNVQAGLARLLAVNRSPDSYLAGAGALHFEPNSKRYSNDLDYFHDSVERVASAFEADRRLLEAHSYQLMIEIKQPGYIRAQVEREGQSTKIEWAHDSDWRFMPVMCHEACGFQLHPIDLATNKVLALAGRDEPRDYLDVMLMHQDLLPLGALCWAAVGKDPGFTPLSLLELLRRRGKHRPEEFSRLHLAQPIELQAMKSAWLNALEEAEVFIRSRPADEIGCLYYDDAQARFVAPTQPGRLAQGSAVVVHYGRPGGVLPRIA
jgi:hypothetical protein